MTRSLFLTVFFQNFNVNYTDKHWGTGKNLQSYQVSTYVNSDTVVKTDSDVLRGSHPPTHPPLSSVCCVMGGSYSWFRTFCTVEHYARPLDQHRLRGQCA